MNDYTYSYIAEDINRKLNTINREAWKYESLLQKSKPFYNKMLTSRKRKQITSNSPCCA